MKAILAFAFLVIAAQATTPAYFLGFSEQIGLNNEQMKHGEVCFAAVRQVMMDVHHLIQSKQAGVSEVLRSVIELIQDVEHKLKIDCSIYMNDVASTFMKNYKGGDIKAVASTNFNTYGPEVIQQIAKYFDFIAARDHYEAGRTEAYIYQILLGLEQPKVTPHPHFDYSTYVHQDPAMKLQGLTKGFFEGLGLHDSKAVRDNHECRIAIDKFIWENLFHSFPHAMEFARNTSSKIHAIEEFVHNIVNLHNSCIDATAFDLQYIVLPILNVFKVAPFHATLAVIHNYAINLPELVQIADQINVNMWEGRAEQAGNLHAQLFMKVFSNFLPRH